MKPIAREELRRALPHIFDAFNASGAYYAWRVLSRRHGLALEPDANVAAVADATLSATLMHLRALDEFFTRGARADAIRAEQFPGYSTPGPFLTPAEKVEINKRLAHISWHRERPFDGHYVRRQMGAAIDRMAHFLQYLRSDFLQLTEPEFSYVVGLERRLHDIQGTIT